MWASCPPTPVRNTEWKGGRERGEVDDVFVWNADGWFGASVWCVHMVYGPTDPHSNAPDGAEGGHKSSRDRHYPAQSHLKITRQTGTHPQTHNHTPQNNATNRPVFVVLGRLAPHQAAARQRAHAQRVLRPRPAHEHQGELRGRVRQQGN